MKNADNKSESAILRRKAEELLKKKSSKTDSELSETDTIKLIHDLELRQIELELQIEELESVKHKTENVSGTYSDKTISLNSEIMKNVAEGIYLIRLQDCIIVYANTRFENMFGYEPGELIGKEVSIVNAPTDKSPEETKKTITEILIETGEWHGEVKNIKKDGTQFWCYANVSLFDHPEHGKVIVAVHTDITERIMIDEALQESEKKYRLLFDNSSQIILVAQGEFLRFANPKASEVIGYSNEELLSIPLSEFIYPDDRDTVVGNYKKRLKGEPVPNSYQFRMLRKDKTIRWVEAHAVLFKWHGNSASLNFLSDITERKIAEDALRKSEKLFRTLIENSLDLITLTDENGIITFIGDQCENVLGYPSSEFIGRIIPDIIHPDDKIKCQEKWEQVFHHGLIVNEFEYRIIDSKNKVRWIAHSASMVKDDGKSIGMQNTIRNITERKQAEILLQNINEELKQTNDELYIAKEHAEESDRLKSAFLANMSHEIRTPMNGILGFAQLLKEPRLSGEEQQKYISIIEKSGSRMLNIINDIVNVSKIESGQMEVSISETNINKQIEYIYSFFKPEVEAKRMHISIKITLPSKEATIYSDREKIYAILTNLVNNAIKYSNKGSIEIGYNRKADCEPVELEFFVKDTGIGIPKDRQEAIFDRFVQADLSDKRTLLGAGLGLAITKAYVELLGGRIWIESEVGKGSTFYFTIPYNTKPEEEIAIKIADSGEKEQKRIKHLKLLIAEDDETSYALITEALKKIRYKVIHAKTGIEAVEACRKNPDIDVILMDIRMPIMNGFEATRQIRQFNKDVVIIAQTAYGLDDDREKALEAGCNEYISKPFSIAFLKGLTQKYFNNLKYLKKP